MVKTYINSMARQYSRAMNPRLRTNGAALALGTSAMVFGLRMGAMAIEADTYSNDTGKSFSMAWDNVRAAYGNTWRNGAIGVLIGAYLFAELAIYSSKSESKRYAEFVVKRYLHNSHVNVPNADSRVYRDIANLLLANMTAGERQSILDVGISVRQALDKNNALSLAGEQTPAQGRVQRKCLLIKSKDIISEYLDSVLMRNPGLEPLIYDMLNGKTYFNPRMFNQHQK